jgi:hypothetical protein
LVRPVSHCAWHFAELARFDFESYFHRALLIAALILLWPLLRALRIGRWRELALEKNPRGGADLAIGFAIAAIPLSVAARLSLPSISIRCGRRCSGIKCRAYFVAASIVLFRRNTCFFGGFILGVFATQFSRLMRSFLPRTFLNCAFPESARPNHA